MIGGLPLSAARAGGAIVAGLAVVLVACGGGSGSGSRANPGGENFGPPTSDQSVNQSVPTTAPLNATAAQIDSLLQKSKTARLSVQDTVNGVGSCALAPADGQRAMEGAIATRRQVLDQMAPVGFESLTNGAKLRSELSDALTASIEAGRDFQAWMGFVASAPCRGTAPHDANWDAASAASTRATAAKQAFVADWNPVAATFGLPAWQEGDI